MSLQSELNRLAGTTGMGEQGAAHVISGTSLDLLGALNSLNGTKGLGLQAVLNSLAGTTGLGVSAAASQIVLGHPRIRTARVELHA